MPDRKLWKGAPGSQVETPGAIPEREKRDYPDVTINGTRYQWKPDEEDSVPEEALAVWRQYLEANR